MGAKLGHFVSEETRKKIGKAFKGKKLSEEHKRKVSLALVGKKHCPWTDEQKRKRSELYKGRKHSEETKKKMSKAHSGKKHSEEHNKNVSLALKGKYIKEKSTAWRGGISFEPYSNDWTKTLKRSIRERDNYTCRLCFKQQADVAHSVHHIDYNKKNCNPDNLITLCINCHAKTNYKRDYWIQKFKTDHDDQTTNKTITNLTTRPQMGCS